MGFVKLPKEEDNVETFGCLCGCGEIKFEKFDNNSYFLDYWYPAFYGNQKGIFRTIWERIKNAFLILSGKQFSLFEVMLTNEDVERLSNTLKNAVEEGCKHGYCDSDDCPECRH